MNCKTMHMSNTIFLDQRKIIADREIVRINKPSKFVSHREYQKNLIQGKIHIQQNSNKDFKYR